MLPTRKSSPGACPTMPKYVQVQDPISGEWVRYTRYPRVEVGRRSSWFPWPQSEAEMLRSNVRLTPAA